jgi:multiple sugar transport system permease protein
MFVFLFSWNEFLFAYQLAGDEVATVTVYLPRLRSAIAELYGEIAAASLLSVLPAMAFAWVLQKSLVQGLTMGGGKEL